MSNTKSESKLSQLNLAYEESPEDMRRVADAIAGDWTRKYKKIVLFMNKAGLISRMRFGKRS